MGWNNAVSINKNPLFEGLEMNALFYFLHSYYVHCNDAKNSIAVADYGIDFSCAINKENIFAVQFHPEKSHAYGEKLLANFAKI